MAHITRADAIARIKKALKATSDKPWSVKGGKGTAYGWITVIAPPRRCIRTGHMSPEDCAELTKLFLHSRTVHFQGLSISPDAREYVVEAIEKTAEVANRKREMRESLAAFDKKLAERQAAKAKAVNS